MKLLRYLLGKLEHAIAHDLLEWLKARALVLPSDVRDTIARDFGIPRPIVDHIEARLRAILIEQIEQWLRRR